MSWFARLNPAFSRLNPGFGMSTRLVLSISTRILTPRAWARSRASTAVRDMMFQDITRMRDRWGAWLMAAMILPKIALRLARGPRALLNTTPGFGEYRFGFCRAELRSSGLSSTLDFAGPVSDGSVAAGSLGRTGSSALTGAPIASRLAASASAMKNRAGRTCHSFEELGRQRAPLSTVTASLNPQGGRRDAEAAL